MPRHFQRLGLALVAALAGAATLAAQSAPRVAFTDTKMKNGLRVIISEDHFAPVYAIAVSYSVGSKDERAGRTRTSSLSQCSPSVLSGPPPGRRRSAGPKRPASAPTSGRSRAWSSRW